MTSPNDITLAELCRNTCLGAPGEKALNETWVESGGGRGGASSASNLMGHFPETFKIQQQLPSFMNTR